MVFDDSPATPAGLRIFGSLSRYLFISANWLITKEYHYNDEMIPRELLPNWMYHFFARSCVSM